MKLYLIRHGQTDWNVDGKIQGSHDIPLNDTGKKQAQCLAKGMDKRPVEKIFSSTLERAKETALMLSARQKKDVYLMPALVEVEFGQWEGLTWGQIQEKYPEEYARWDINPVEVAPPGGETQLQVLKRCAAAVEKILEITGRREDGAVISHGASLAYLVAYMMRGHDDQQEIIVENASITTVDYNPITRDFRLLEVNDVSHMEGVSF